MNNQKPSFVGWHESRFNNLEKRKVLQWGEKTKIFKGKYNETKCYKNPH